MCSRMACLRIAPVAPTCTPPRDARPPRGVSGRHVCD
jgi:hypothetical protein